MESGYRKISALLVFFYFILFSSKHFLFQDQGFESFLFLFFYFGFMIICRSGDFLFISYIAVALLFQLSLNK